MNRTQRNIIVICIAVLSASATIYCGVLTYYKVKTEQRGAFKRAHPVYIQPGSGLSRQFEPENDKNR